MTPPLPPFLQRPFCFPAHLALFFSLDDLVEKKAVEIQMPSFLPPRTNTPWYGFAAQRVQSTFPHCSSIFIHFCHLTPTRALSEKLLWYGFTGVRIPDFGPAGATKQHLTSYQLLLAVYEGVLSHPFESIFHGRHLHSWNMCRCQKGSALTISGQDSS